MLKTRSHRSALFPICAAAALFCGTITTSAFARPDDRQADSESSDPVPIEKIPVEDYIESALRWVLKRIGWDNAVDLTTMGTDKKHVDPTFSPPPSPTGNLIPAVTSIGPAANPRVDGFMPIRIIVCTIADPSTGAGPGSLPPGTHYSDATFTAASGNIFPMTITPITNLEDPTQVLAAETIFGQACTFTWNFNYIPADKRTGLFYLLKADIPVPDFIPAPGTLAVAFGGLGLIARRHRQR